MEELTVNGNILRERKRGYVKSCKKFLGGYWRSQRASERIRGRNVEIKIFEVMGEEITREEIIKCVKLKKWQDCRKGWYPKCVLQRRW